MAPILEQHTEKTERLVMKTAFVQFIQLHEHLYKYVEVISLAGRRSASEITFQSSFSDERFFFEWHTTKCLFFNHSFRPLG